MSDIEKNIINEYSMNSNIIFGPFIGDLLWEVCSWAPFIHYLKTVNPDKNIKVCTRTDRIDLYYGICDDFILYNIEGDYTELIPEGCNIKNINTVTRSDIMGFSKKKGFKQISPVMRWRGENFFFKKNIVLDNYRYHPNNKELLQEMLDKRVAYNNITLIPKFSSRTENKIKQEKLWDELFEKISTYENYNFLIVGKNGSYFKPKIKSENIFILEDMKPHPSNYTSLIGLTMCSLENSILGLGEFCGNVALGYLLDCNTITWGDENEIEKFEKQWNNKCERINFNKFKIEDYI